MRFSTFVIVAASAAIAAMSSQAFAAQSCPGGGTLTNCTSHCTLTVPPKCTETCQCAIIKGKVGGYKATAAYGHSPKGHRPPVNIGGLKPPYAGNKTGGNSHPVTIMRTTEHHSNGGGHR